MPQLGILCLPRLSQISKKEDISSYLNLTFLRCVTLTLTTYIQHVLEFCHLCLICIDFFPESFQS